MTTQTRLIRLIATILLTLCVSSTLQAKAWKPGKNCYPYESSQKECDDRRSAEKAEQKRLKREAYAKVADKAKIEALDHKREKAKEKARTDGFARGTKVAEKVTRAKRHDEAINAMNAAFARASYVECEARAQGDNACPDLLSRVAAHGGHDTKPAGAHEEDRLIVTFDCHDFGGRTYTYSRHCELTIRDATGRAFLVGKGEEALVRRTDNSVDRGKADDNAYADAYNNLLPLP